MWVSNWVAWTAQVAILAAVGCLLPVLLRVWHPRTELAYCHAVLVACMLLPALEPWRHPVILQRAQAVEETTAAVPRSSAVLPKEPSPGAPETRLAPRPPSPAPAAISTVWTSIQAGHLLLWLFVAGAAGKLCWLLGSLWRIRRFRIGSTPLYPVPESVHAASAITHADALFCISPDITSPVMMGWLAPVVLLPESFLALGAEAQCAVACHECLHVRRHDWLVTLFEELAAVLFWFHPAIWLLLARTRLVREQLVDDEVVRLTASREPYLDALLAIARGRPVLDLAPAPLFLHRRHLTHRMHSLLREVGVSRFRLVSSYGSIAAILAVAAWFGLASFPLIGSPQIQEIAVQTAALSATAQVPVQPPPRPAVRVPAYPSAALAPDPRELVTAAVQIPSTPEERAVALALMQRAQQNSQLHLAGWTPPHRIEASFTSNGNSDFVGPGTFTETWLSGRSWRWTTDLGAFSQVRIGFQGHPYEDKPVSETPLRVHLLRGAIFWAARQMPPNTQIRAAQAMWEGQPITCLLVSQSVLPAAQGRQWEEEEFCIDEASGLVRLHSFAPGTYTVYSYGAVLFHQRPVPERIEIYVNGVLAIDAQIRVADLTGTEAGLLTLTPEMVAAGPAMPEAMTQRMTVEVPNPAVREIQPVIVIAEVDGHGNAMEEELSQAADPALAQAAMDLVKGTHFGALGNHRQVFVRIRFVPMAQ